MTGKIRGTQIRGNDWELPNTPGLPDDPLTPHQQAPDLPAAAKAPPVLAPYLRVPNFENCRHYANRASTPWIKLHDRWLDDYRFSRLPDAQKLQVLLLWLLANRYDNLIPNDPGYVGYKLALDQPVELNTLVALGWLEPVPVQDVPKNRPLPPRKPKVTRQMLYARRIKKRRGRPRKDRGGAPAGPGGEEIAPTIGGEGAEVGAPAGPPAAPRRKAGALLRRFRQSEPI